MTVVASGKGERMHSLTIPEAEAELLLSASWLPDHAIFTAADLDLDFRVNCRPNKGDTAAFRVCRRAAPQAGRAARRPGAADRRPGVGAPAHLQPPALRRNCPNVCTTNIVLMSAPPICAFSLEMPGHCTQFFFSMLICQSTSRHLKRMNSHFQSKAAHIRHATQPCRNKWPSLWLFCTTARFADSEFYTECSLLTSADALLQGGAQFTLRACKEAGSWQWQVQALEDISHSVFLFEAVGKSETV